MLLAFFPFSLSGRGVRRLLTLHCQRSLKGNSTMNVLNVAEKNDAAKNIASLLSRGTALNRFGMDKYSKVYEFKYQVFGGNVNMIMTSVRGHIKSYDFDVQGSWDSMDPILLFEAPIKKKLVQESLGIKKTLENEIKKCSKLIIWTDCDREGENIGFEIIEVCKAVKKDIEIYRAVFSEITLQSVTRAISHLQTPKKCVSNAVDVRAEFDLRTGAAFTRLQTLYLKKTFPNVPNWGVISYGSCQFPTLGFVVERFKAVSEFKPEAFWKINVQHKVNDLVVEFKWKRNRLLDQLACEVLFDKCVESGMAKVENIETTPKIKHRPNPLDTTALQILASRKFRLTAKETLKVAESLYTKGLISYPRTETNIFAKNIDLTSLVELQRGDVMWGEFAQKVLRDGPDPFQGFKSDHAHPPIHPIKHTSELVGSEKKVYELIVRHFLACVSKDAEGLETTVEIDLSGEKFSAKGLVVTAQNYLEVYPYHKWSEREIPSYVKDELFKPEISMVEGETSPPPLLTEADLISLMEKHGIGTDATHADHIDKVRERLYVGLQDNMYFVPRTLGMGLIEGYNSMGYPLAKPELRAVLESDLEGISKGRKTPTEVLATHLEKYKKIYEGVQKELNHLSKAIQTYIEVEAVEPKPELFQKTADRTVGKCPQCHSSLILKSTKEGSKFLGCSKFPNCRVVFWLPSFVLDVSETEDSCPTCSNQRFLQFKFRRGSCYLAPEYIGCIGGCDLNLLELLNFRPSGHKTTPRDNRFEIPEEDFTVSNKNSSRGWHADKSSPMCFCGIPAICVTVKKSGPNHGRGFYMCSIKNSSKCDFFLWKDSTEPTNERNTNCNHNPTSNEGNVDVRCFCSIPCRSFVVQRGVNRGRRFICCGRSMDDKEKCPFFKWVDGDDHNDSSHWQTMTRIRGNKPNDSQKGYYTSRGYGSRGTSNWRKRNFKSGI